MELCEVCGTENRDKAKFCRGCARALLPIEASLAATDKDSNRALRCGVCKAIHSRGAQTCQACGSPLGDSLGDPKPTEIPKASENDSPQRKAGRWPWLVVSALLVAAMAIWAMNRVAPDEATQASMAVPSLVEPAAQVGGGAGPQPNLSAQPVLASPQAPAPMDASMSAAEKIKFDELVAREAERAEKSRQAIVRLAEQEKAVKEARVVAKAAADRQRAEASRQTPEPIKTTVTDDSKTAQAPQVPAVASVAPPSPVIKKTVEQVCESTTNFFARDLCRIAACKEASNVRDPICVGYRRLEQDQKNRMAN